MFGAKRLERDAVIEVAYARKLHGDAALGFLRRSAARPTLRTRRRKILVAAVRRMERELRPPRRLFGFLGSQAKKTPRTRGPAA